MYGASLSDVAKAWVRVDVRRSGCSGWAYVLDYADTIKAEDRVYEVHGVKVIVHSENLPLL